MHVPLLAIENSADDAVPQTHVFRLFAASPAATKDYLLIKEANHYYAQQPELLQQVVSDTLGWLRRNGLMT